MSRGLCFTAQPLQGFQTFQKMLEANCPKNCSGAIKKSQDSFFKFERREKWMIKVLVAANHSTNQELIPYIPEASSRPDATTFYSASETIDTICRPKSMTSKSFIYVRDLISHCLGTKCQVHKCDGLPRRPVGLIDQAREVESLLKRTSVLSIVGMGGVGKTTIAKQLFNDVSGQFEYTCFVGDVKEWTPKSTLGDHIKRSFYKRGRKVETLVNWNDLKRQKTLIVLDDVDSEEQFKCLPDLDAMGEDIHIVVTSRDRGIMCFFDGCKEYDVPFLSPENSESLFCWHAFRQENIPKSLSSKLKGHVKQVITKCDGLPLSLEVLGSYLRGHENEPMAWTETIAKLEKAESVSGNKDDRVWAKLQVSYDALAETERQMFIDIATFFVNGPVDDALAAWSTVYESSVTGWANLVSRCLVKTNDVVEMTFRYLKHIRFPYKKIWMHEQLQALGKKIFSANSGQSSQ